MLGAQGAEESSRAVSNIVDGPRGDAFTVAQEVGLVSVTAPAAIATLINRMKETVFSPTAAEAK